MSLCIYVCVSVFTSLSVCPCAVFLLLRPSVFLAHLSSCVVLNECMPLTGVSVSLYVPMSACRMSLCLCFVCMSAYLYACMSACLYSPHCLSLPVPSFYSFARLSCSSVLLSSASFTFPFASLPGTDCLPLSASMSVSLAVYLFHHDFSCFPLDGSPVLHPSLRCPVVHLLIHLIAWHWNSVRR